MIEAKITGLLEPICAQTYPVVAPASALAPFIIYTRVSTPRPRDLDGVIGMAQPRFQVDVYAANFDDARALADRVRVALSSYRDTDVNDVDCTNEHDMSDLESDTGLTRIMLEFRVTHRE